MTDVALLMSGRFADGEPDIPLDELDRQQVRSVIIRGSDGDRWFSQQVTLELLQHGSVSITDVKTMVLDSLKCEPTDVRWSWGVRG